VTALLTLQGLDAGYGAVQVLRGVDLDVRPGEIHCLLGRNGAGKSTLVKAVMGLVRASAGRVVFDGQDLTDLAPHRVPGLGIGYVPQGRRLFGELTVAQNLEIGLMARRRGREVRARMLELFPVLQDRLGQRAATLSGGEQQMLAMARALCLEPRLLLLDEPTEGLQPSMIQAIREVTRGLRAEGVATILVEQRVAAVRALADRVTFLENGQTQETVAAADLVEDDARLRRYVGVGA